MRSQSGRKEWCRRLTRPTTSQATANSAMIAENYYASEVERVDTGLPLSFSLNLIENGLSAPRPTVGPIVMAAGSLQSTNN